jgi:hypothetical protein
MQGRQRSGTDDYGHDRLIPYLASGSGAIRGYARAFLIDRSMHNYSGLGNRSPTELAGMSADEGRFSA